MILPHWSDLPGFDLHLDQLIELTNGYLRPITGDIVTKTMMHNYFKADVLVAPDKKSYHKIHLAGAIIVGLLKNIFVWLNSNSKKCLRQRLFVMTHWRPFYFGSLLKRLCIV